MRIKIKDWSFEVENVGPVFFGDQGIDIYFKTDAVKHITFWNYKLRPNNAKAGPDNTLTEDDFMLLKKRLQELLPAKDLLEAEPIKN